MVSKKKKNYSNAEKNAFFVGVGVSTGGMRYPRAQSWFWHKDPKIRQSFRNGLDAGLNGQYQPKGLPKEEREQIRKEKRRKLKL